MEAQRGTVRSRLFAEGKSQCPCTGKDNLEKLSWKRMEATALERIRRLNATSTSMYTLRRRYMAWKDGWKEETKIWRKSGSVCRNKWGPRKPAAICRSKLQTGKIEPAVVILHNERKEQRIDKEASSLITVQRVIITVPPFAPRYSEISHHFQVLLTCLYDRWRRWWNRRRASSCSVGGLRNRESSAARRETTTSRSLTFAQESQDRFPFFGPSPWGLRRGRRFGLSSR